MPKVVISGYYGFDNWGDEAILETASTGLTSTIPDLEITVLSGNPSKTTARYGLSAVSRTNPLHILRAIKAADMFISGGGSLLQDVTSSRSLWYYLGIIKAAVQRGKKVMLYANGIGPITRPVNRAITRRVLDRVSLITVRGPSSLESLRELGVTRPKIVETADTAFAVEPAPLGRVSAICAEEGLPDLTNPGTRPFVGIVVRPWHGTGRLETMIARAADYIVEKLDYSILFLPVHQDLDFPVLERTRRTMRNESYVLKGTYSAVDIVGVLANLRWVLSMRLHPLIFAAVGGVPAIGLVYDPKVEEFLSQTEQVSLGPVEKVGGEDILLGINEVEEDYEARVARLSGVVKEFRRKAQLNNILAAELLLGK